MKLKPQVHRHKEKLPKGYLRYSPDNKVNSLIIISFYIVIAATRKVFKAFTTSLPLLF